MSLTITEQEIADGTLWRQFCDALKRAGEQVLRAEAPGDPFNRAEGFRYLTRLTRAALEKEVEFNDPRLPVLYSLSHETIKIGADNPDNFYQNARIDGSLEYRIKGTRGTVHYLAFSTKAGSYGTDGRMEPTGFLDSDTLQVEPDGTFEIIASQSSYSGNWLPMTADSELLIVRQTFLDRGREEPAKLKIECSSEQRMPGPLEPERFAHQLMSAAHFVESTAAIFADWSQQFSRYPNKLVAQDQAPYRAAGGDPTIYYIHGYWELADDEAMVIDVPLIPICDTWNLQIDNYWMESLDYRYHRIHVNKHTAVYNPDGGVTIVLAHRDPSAPNWLTTAGHKMGTCLFRWIGAREYPLPMTRVVKFSDIAQYVSPDMSPTEGAIE